MATCEHLSALVNRPILRLGAWLVLMVPLVGLSQGAGWEQVLPPQAGDIQYVTHADAGVFYAHAGDTLWVSTDRGTTWQSTPITSAHDIYGRPVHVSAVAVHPSNPPILYAGARRAVGVSRDRGETWDWGSPTGALYRVGGITVSPSDPAQVLVAMWDTSTGDLYATTDDRKTWRRLPGPIDPAPVRNPGPSWFSFVHPDTNCGYTNGFYGLHPFGFVEACPDRLTMRTLGDGDWGTAYGFNTENPHEVLVSNPGAGAQLDVRHVGSDVLDEGDRHGDVTARLRMPMWAHAEGAHVYSHAFEGRTETYLLAVRAPGSHELLVIGTTDLGESWQTYGSLAHDGDRIPGLGNVWQLHFLEGETDLFMRTRTNWYRWPRGRATPVAGSGQLPITWGELRSE